MNDEIKAIAQSVWDAAYGADDAVGVLGAALQTERDRAEELLEQRDALIARLRVWQHRVLKAEAELAECRQQKGLEG